MTIEEELALIRQNGSAPPAAAAPASAAAEPDPYADLPPPEEGLDPLPSNDASTWDVMSAGWQSETIRTDAWGYTNRQRQSLAMDMFKLLPEDVRASLNQRVARGNLGWNSWESLIVDEASRVASSSPEAAQEWAGYPLSIDAFNRQIDIERRRDLNEAQSILDQPGGVVAEFVGSAARAMTDEVSLALLPFGVSGSALRTIAVEAGLGALGEAAVLPREFRVAEELDQPDPDAFSRVLMGAALGAGFSGAILGIAKGYSVIRSRSLGLRAAAPDGADALEFEAAVDSAEGVLRGDQTVREATAPEGGPPGTLGAILANDAPGILPPVQPDAPENWAAIRNGIFAGESGGDYNALFGFQNRKGGKFSRVRLTEMTVDEALAFADPSGPYGQWVKTQVGRVATPMGAYQIVGTTLRAAKNAMGLQGDELMTPELQEKIAHWIYRTQGTDAWEGYRGPRSTFTPVGADADAPNLGNTSRGYTGSGQVRAGDDFTVDVQYEVVDLASLTRASGDLQPRDRSRIASDAWIADTASRLDPAQLMPSPTADRGAPIVGPDNVIESGNGRYGAIARAYERFPDRAQAYRQQIEAAGFAVPEGVTQPVLVARRTSELSSEDRVRFTVAAQDSGVAVMTPTEIARTSSRAMSSPVLAQLDPTRPLTDAANGGFVRSVLQGLPRSARNAMFDASGMLNALGTRQLREALFARAWPDPDILARFTETDAGELRSLMDALDQSAPAWAALKADIEAGLVRPEMDISGYVLDAMRLIGAARDLAGRQGMPIATAVKELLEDVDLIEGAISPLAAAMVRKFWQNGRAAKADDVASFLTRYADDARKAGAEGGMFDAPGPREVLAAIDPKTFGDLPEDLGNVRGFARPGDADKAEAIATTPEEGFDAGATSPEAAEVDAEIRASFEAEPDPERAVQSEIVALREEFDDFDIELPDGTSVKVADVLADLDADRQFDAFIQACAITPTGGAQ